MERELIMTFYETGLTPPMWPIAIKTTKLSLYLTTSSTSQTGWRKFEIQKVSQIGPFMFQELFHKVMLGLSIVRKLEVTVIGEQIPESLVLFRQTL